MGGVGTPHLVLPATGRFDDLGDCRPWVNSIVGVLSAGLGVIKIYTGAKACAGPSYCEQRYEQSLLNTVPGTDIDWNAKREAIA